MELPDDSPRLPKIPFIIGDLILLSVAALLAYRMGSDPTTAEIVGIVVTTGLAVAVGLAPFVISYAREQDQLLRNRERMLESLVRSTATAADQASIAANGLHEIAEKTKANLDTLDSLPATIQAARKAAEAASAKSIDIDLGPVRDEVTALREDLAAKTAELGARIDAAVVAMANCAPSMVRPVGIEAAPLETPPEPAPPPTRRPTRRKKSEPAPPPPVEDSLFGGEIAQVDLPEVNPPVVEAEPDKPAKKRKPRQKKSAPEDKTDTPLAPEESPAETKTEVTPASVEEKSDSEDKSPASTLPAADEVEAPPVAPVVETVFETELDETAASPPTTAAERPESSETPPASSAAPESDEAAVLPLAEEEAPAPSITDDTPNEEVLDEPVPEEPALSSDGMTRITVTAYIGIGNRLFIRGEGPGLSRDEGVPLQFVSIGKWRWETDGATEPVKVTLWKNDEEECTSAGEIELRPGAQLETSANF